MAMIQIRIHSLAQLFDALDPAPVQARALDRSVERYIRDSALTVESRVPLSLCVHLPESLRSHASIATDAIHAHFRRVHSQGEQGFRRRLRIGGVAFAIAVGVLAVSLWLRGQLSNLEGEALVQGFREGLLIFGWVAMWRPVEILLFEPWERRLDQAVLERLANIPVAYVLERDAAPET